jgi:hypothetical protein
MTRNYTGYLIFAGLFALAIWFQSGNQPAIINLAPGSTLTFILQEGRHQVAEGYYVVNYGGLPGGTNIEVTSVNHLKGMDVSGAFVSTSPVTGPTGQIVIPARSIFSARLSLADGKVQVTQLSLLQAGSVPRPLYADLKDPEKHAFQLSFLQRVIGLVAGY